MHNWQKLVSDAHAKAFTVQALSPQLTGCLYGLLSRAIRNDMALAGFYSLAERDMKNGE